MLDMKIMAAVLTTLTAVAVTTGGGTVEKSEVENLEIDQLKDIPSSNILNKLNNLVRNQPDPENTVEANLTIRDLSQKSLKVNNADIKASGLKKISLGSKNMSSDKNILLKNVEGTLNPGKETKINLNSKEILTSGVKISGDSKIVEEIGSKIIKIKNVEKIDLKYSEATGTIKTNSTTSEIDSSQKIDIKSFSGNMTLRPQKDKLELKGKFFSLNSGELQFGG